MKANTVRIDVQCPHCSKAFAVEGDVPGVSHLIVQWMEGADAVPAGSNVGTVGVIRPGPPPVLMLSLPMADGKRVSFSVPVNPRGGPIGPAERPSQYGMRSLGPGVYTLEPSLVINNAVHVFVTITDVPVPPPWG